MTQYHSSAAVSFQAQVIQNFLGILAGLNTFLEWLESGADHVPTCETFYWNYD